MMKRRSDEHKFIQLWESFCYCIFLSWRASGFYTCLQFGSRIAAVLIPIAVTWNTREILNLFGSPERAGNTGGELAVRMTIMLILYLLRLLTGQLGTYAGGMQQDLLMHYIEQEMAQTAVEMDLEYFDNPQYYDAFETVKQDVYSVLGAVYDGISGVSYGISVCGCVCLLVRIAPVYTVLILLFAVPVAVSEHFYTKKVYLWGLEHVREERQMQYLYRASTERMHAQEVRLYGIGKYLTEKHHRLWQEYFLEKRSVVRRRAAWNLLLSVFPELLSIAALLHIGKRVLLGMNSIGDFTFYSGLLVQMTGGLQCFVTSVMGLYEKKLKVDHFSHFRSFVCKKVKSGTKLLEDQVDIEFRDVSFRYPGTEHYVLKHVSFHVPPGGKLCIVGENGAGKSTMLKLLLHFYEPEEGQILLNGIPVGEYDADSIRDRFSCFFQKASNFAFTLQENVRISQIGKAQEFREECQEKALRMAGAGILVQKLPHGENTYLTRAFSDEGIELSGGQNQKIALARMFYRDSAVLVLDEPTADLDPQSEYELFQAIQKECGTQSLLFVSHRLSNVFLADEILVMEDGCVCARGTHSDLMEKCELYRRLYHYQADKYIMKEKYAGSDY